MNTTKFLAILSVLGFSLSGFLFLKNQKEEKACREEISKQDLNPKDEGADGGISISEILERNTVPAWRSVKFFNTAVSIPYSEKWKSVLSEFRHLMKKVKMNIEFTDLENRWMAAL